MEHDALFSQTDRDMGAIRKWLRVLLAVHIVMLSFSVLCNVISFGKLYNWINAALDVAVIFCLLQLRRENRLYKLAAGLMIANIVTNLIGMPTITYCLLIFFNGHKEAAIYFFRIISYVGIACALGAIAAEYVAHSRLIQNTDPELRKWWLWLLAAHLAVYAINSVLGSVLKELIEAGTLSVLTYQNGVYVFLRLPGTVISVLYIICLYKTERKLAKR